jgi:hypothetical protein
MKSLMQNHPARHCRRVFTHLLSSILLEMKLLDEWPTWLTVLDFKV